MKVLIAEDDPIARLLLKNALEKEGYEATVAQDGSEALRIFVDSPFRIVISDWNMPGLTGLEFCTAIRQQPSPEYTYFILLTSYDETSENYRRAIDAGVDDMLVKPFDRERIALRLRVASRIVHYATQIQKLESLLPICMYCKKIHNDADSWEPLESYLHNHIGSDITHGICPECYSEKLKAIHAQ